MQWSHMDFIFDKKLDPIFPTNWILSALQKKAMGKKIESYFFKKICL